MEEMFKGVFEELIRINKFLDNNVLRKEDIAEERENYDDFLQTLKKLNELLITFQMTPIEDFRKGTENLVHLHSFMSSLSWYINNLHERVIDTIKHYPVPDDL
jgi:hypothetical protein